MHSVLCHPSFFLHSHFLDGVNICQMDAEKLVWRNGDLKQKRKISCTWENQKTLQLETFDLLIHIIKRKLRYRKIGKITPKNKWVMNLTKNYFFILTCILSHKGLMQASFNKAPILKIIHWPFPAFTHRFVCFLTLSILIMAVGAIVLFWICLVYTAM